MEKTFMPFTHDDLDFKNELINYARDLSKKDTWENKLSAAFIYTSFAEYLASHLLMNLRHIVWMGTQSQFAGILGIDERKDDKKSTLGQLIFKIEKYDFPNKKNIIEMFETISSLRNNLFHNFAKSNLDELKKIISDDFEQIFIKTEELIGMVNTTYAGIYKILNPEFKEPVQITR